MAIQRSRIVAWVATCIVPHEAGVRAWLRRALLRREDIDDLIQEAYCRIASLDSIDHITRPDAYFFRIVRNLLTEQLRRARIVRIEAVAEIDSLPVLAEEPSLERVDAARRELAKVQELIDALPKRCRRIFVLRKIEDVSQREIARQLGVSESIVENDVVAGMRLIMEAMREQDGSRVRRTERGHDRSRKRGKH